MSTTRSRRTSRRTRKPDPPLIRLTERDRWILEALGKMRFVTTRHLARLHFGGSRWATNKRLRKLLDARLVHVWVRSLSQENVYSLDRAGARLLEKGASGDGWSVPRGLDGNLDHLLAINQVRVSLALSLPEAGGEIVWWRSDWEFVRGRRQVVPDALFAVRWDDGFEQHFALEVDNNSRSLRKFLGKMVAYAQRGRGLLRGLDGIIVLVVCRDPRQFVRYQEALRSARLGERAWFAPLEDVEKRGAVGPVWLSAFDGESRSLRDLSTLPCGKEMFDCSSALVAEG